MGTKIYDLVEKQAITLEDLAHKVIAIDTYLFLYQFLAMIRQQDGRPLTDAHGQITSHLVGLFSRTCTFLMHRIKPVFVFDGEPPTLKKVIREQRKLAKIKAQKQFDQAIMVGDEEAMKKYGARTGTLSPEMLAETKELIQALGIPIVLAPGEGEAQAAHLVKKGDAYAVGSNDADALLFGATRIIKNLSATKKKMRGKEIISIECIELPATLTKRGLSQDQLIFLGMLVGTDYNPGGIRGIGPQKALALVKKATGEELFSFVKWNDFFPYPWQDVFALIKNAAVTDDYQLVWTSIDKKRVISLLCEKHDFLLDRVEKTLASLPTGQMTLGGFV